ncbi:MAG TPA: VOC family protein [Gammaproteobacteria bacterium]|nr:VOC family protein [Gammaproteobacteria bacterium]
MLHHVSIGVADVARAAQFYDRVLQELGYKRVLEVLPYGIGYGDKQPSFWVQLPHNQQPAAVGNGAHVAFNATSEEMIRAFHRAALEAGGSDDGAPGPRPDYGPDYFGAFVRDLDGNKIEAVLVRSPAAAKKKTAKKASGKSRATKKTARGAKKTKAARAKKRGRRR